MTQVLTLRVIQGADRGRIFENLTAPITIGREEGNIVQVNDERVSRTHVKIQEDAGCLLVTDLGSTNGTKVNGQVCNVKLLHIGDTISIGRTVLLLDRREVPASHLVGDSDQGGEADPRCGGTHVKSTNSLNGHSVPPIVPKSLSILQAAQLRELLDHVHVGIQDIIEHATVDEKQRLVVVDQVVWRQLLEIQSDISVWIRNIEDPQANHS